MFASLFLSGYLLLAIIIFPKIRNAAPLTHGYQRVTLSRRKLTQKVIITLRRLRWPVIFSTVKNKSALSSIAILLLEILPALFVVVGELRTSSS